ncbi:MAG: hypothetical protein LBS64_00830 [Spirochaetaceae bacterium]|jgi:tetratricopeptide (TPR) repeat protein|nr:hypothetical protein [Spirochaetaceae bacterium]
MEFFEKLTAGFISAGVGGTGMTGGEVRRWRPCHPPRSLWRRTLLCILAAGALTLVSCRAVVDDTAFAARMARTDTYISAGNTRAAVRHLRVYSRRTLTVVQRLGVYRRLMSLNQSADAEWCLLRGLKTQSADPELNGVYTWFLMDQGRSAEANDRAKALTGTRYESLGAELDFRADPFSLSALRSLAAWRTARTGPFLTNAAVALAAGGDIGGAARLYAELPDARGPEVWGRRLFWSTLFLDTGDFDAVTKFGVSFIVSPESENSDPAARLEGALLLQDALDSAGNFDDGKKVRDWILASFDSFIVPPVVYYNRARDASLEGDPLTRSIMLNTLVNEYPGYWPGLAAYGVFARERAAAEDSRTDLERELRAAGLRSRGMAAADRIAAITVAEVLEKMRTALDREYSPEMQVEYFKLDRAARLAAGREEGVRFPWLWNALEGRQRFAETAAAGEPGSGTLDTDLVYPPTLVQYALAFLLAHEHFDDARRLFGQYAGARGGTEEYFTAPAWAMEAAAYFAALDGDSLLAEERYKRLLESTGELLPDGAKTRYYRPPLRIYLNLAEIYAGTGRPHLAVALCRKALDAFESTLDKADIAYHLAVIQLDNAGPQAAAAGLEYCLMLNPAHTAARAALRALRSGT